jgi:hypothetical protein
MWGEAEIRSRIMLTIVEKLGLLMKETVGIHKKAIISCEDSFLVRVFGKKLSDKSKNFAFSGQIWYFIKK